MGLEAGTKGAAPAAPFFLECGSPGAARTLREDQCASEVRQVLECASPLALSNGRGALEWSGAVERGQTVRKRQRAGALQDASRGSGRSGALHKLRRPCLEPTL